MNRHFSPAAQIADALGGSKKTSTGWMARCPCHDDKNASLSVSDGRNGSVVLHCHAGCDPLKVIDVLRDRGLWQDSERKSTTGSRSTFNIVAEYNYTDESGALLYQVCRLDPKDFRQRKPDGNGWNWSVRGIKRVPYRLTELIEAIAQERVIFIVEGEKDVDNLATLGVPATCNSGGAGKWPAGAFNEHFKGADVCIIADKDEPGRAHARDVAAKLEGVAKRVALLELEQKDASDWIKDGGTSAALYALADAAPVWKPSNESKSEAPESTTTEAAPDMGEWDAGDDTELPPPRQWLLGNQFCRGFLSGIFAPGSTGKSALRLAQCMALATGKHITGQHVFKRCRVLVVSLEDDRNELRRRIAAARLHHGITTDELKGWLFCSTPKGFKLAEVKNGSRQIGALEKMLRQTIERRRPDLVTLDPFIKLHALEENDNGAMDFVADLLVQLAIEYDIAVDVPHHTKKGQIAAGDADAGRGASSARDAGRLIYTLTRMSEEEAKAFSVKFEDRNLYIRLDSGKVNTAPPSYGATWFKLIGVPLGNGDAEYPNGDEVQTLVPWSPPKTWEGVSNVQLNAALTDIEAGMPNGQRYSDAGSATDRAAWQVIQRHCPDRNEAQCREIVKTWVKNGVLFNENYDDPIARRPRKGLRVNDAKRPGSEA